ncbi:hypothetical protein BDA99DRAFT_562348 [Phascolomyces articulosus]|uniref:Uncharacterized protein n=1 Tax=Phascolomyces articulosus TaxID=60185 RepID=A0AAD5K413_9FUNG|nr:hypothetical protein BDA99DRAFT_562348 [Phascolomyces articulosus]
MNNSQQISFAASKNVHPTEQIKDSTDEQYTNNATPTETKIIEPSSTIPSSIQPSKIMNLFYILDIIKNSRRFCCIIAPACATSMYAGIKKAVARTGLYTFVLVLGIQDIAKHLKNMAAVLCCIENTLTKLSLYVSHPSLVYLELSSPLITGHGVELILQGFQELRRLIADDCDDSVLEVVVDQLWRKKRSIRIVYTFDVQTSRHIRKYTCMLVTISLSVLQVQEFYEHLTRLLIQLFKKYAQAASLSSTTVSSLNQIKLQYYYKHVIMDDMLDVLSNTNSLEEIWLTDLFYKTSTEQVHRLIAKLGKHKLKEICFQYIGEPKSEISLAVPCSW